jgi:hypothetical protein
MVILTLLSPSLQTCSDLTVADGSAGTVIKHFPLTTLRPTEMRKRRCLYVKTGKAMSRPEMLS